MSAEFPKPTRRTTLTQLCTELLPVWSKAFADPALAADAPSLCVQISVEDDTQHVVLHATGARHAAGPAESPHVSISCNKEAWRTAMEHLVGLGIENLEARQHEVRTALTALQPKAHASLATLAQNPGVISLTYVDDAGDAALYTLTLGSGSGPAALISIDDKRLHNLVKGHASVPQILASVDIQGDAVYLTRLAQNFL